MAYEDIEELEREIERELVEENKRSKCGSYPFVKVIVSLILFGAMLTFAMVKVNTDQHIGKELLAATLDQWISKWIEEGELGDEQREVGTIYAINGKIYKLKACDIYDGKGHFWFAVNGHTSDSLLINWSQSTKEAQKVNNYGDWVKMDLDKMQITKLFSLKRLNELWQMSEIGKDYGLVEGPNGQMNGKTLRRSKEMAQGMEKYYNVQFDMMKEGRVYGQIWIGSDCAFKIQNNPFGESRIVQTYYYGAAMDKPRLLQLANLE